MTDDWFDDTDLLSEDLAFDEELRAHLRSSFDAIGPSQEAEDRMLANLLAAQAAQSEQADHQAAVVEPIELPDVDEDGFKLVWNAPDKTARRRPRWRINLAAAASIAAVAISVGVMFSLGNMHSKNTAPDTVAEEATYNAESESAAPMGAEKNVSGNAAEADTVALEAVGDAAASTEESDQEQAIPNDLVFSGGAFDVTGDPSYALAVTYQEVRLYDGRVLHIAEHQGEPVIIAEEWVEDLVEEAEAFSDDGFESVKCWVYRLPVSDDGLYVVRYLEDGSAFAIRVDGT
ncbi:MAG: hypothetical protein Q4D48_04965 [Coriobacteriales bacterium]|nr:hypothetical protein [Coriobacteriales bacterium]